MERETVTLRFFTAGLPQPQGSTRSFVRGGKIVTTSANTSLRPWRSAIAYDAQMAVQALPFGAFCHDDQRRLGVILTATFVVPRPRSVSAKRRPLPTVRPDLDKLERALGDALTGVILADDSVITRSIVEKRYAEPGTEYAIPGVHVCLLLGREPEYGRRKGL